MSSGSEDNWKDAWERAGFLKISTAVRRLADGMYGGFSVAELVRHATARLVEVEGPGRSAKTQRPRFGPQSTDAAQLIRRAAESGALPTWVVKRDAARPDLVSPSAVKLVIGARGGLPDHPTLFQGRRDRSVEPLLDRLRGGLLLVQEKEFAAWYRKQRQRGRWPSQRQRKPTGRGRPRKRSQALDNQILRMVRDDRWDAGQPISKLCSLLKQLHAEDELPSAETISRFVDALFHETGNEKLRRARRSRPGRSRRAAV